MADWLFEHHYYGGMMLDGVDRSGWREKSDAALRRENEATQLFDAFLKDSESATSSFPLTKDVVPARLHLTDACWRTFKKYVVQTGCTTKRRLATPDERSNSKANRSGKMYVISVTIPVHPSAAKSAAREKEIKKEAAAKARAAKALKQQEEAKAMQAKVEEEYGSLVRIMEHGDVHNPALASTDQENQQENIIPPNQSSNKKRKLECSITVPRDRILRYADEDRSKRLATVSKRIEKEKARKLQKLKQELAEEMETKKNELCRKTEELCDRVQESIMELTK